MHRGITKSIKRNTTAKEKEKVEFPFGRRIQEVGTKKNAVEDHHRELAQVVVVLPGEQPVQRKSQQRQALKSTLEGKKGYGSG